MRSQRVERSVRAAGERQLVSIHIERKALHAPACRRLGLGFVLKSLACVTALSLIAEPLPRAFIIDTVHPALGAVILAAALTLFPASVVLYSLLGALVLNAMIAFNHRRDRYITT